ncbi:MAG: cell division protein FtsQ/DivIB [Solirubrobacteraceae bacterium]
MHRLKIAGVLAVLAALYGGWLFLRDAPLFAVQKVAITGIAGPGAPAIRATLANTAQGMTTTHLEVARLRAAVAAFAVVRDIHVQTEFPHGLRIQVIEEVPVAAIAVGGQRLAVAADGRILRGTTPPSGLTAVAVGATPTGSRLSDPAGIQGLELLDIAPPGLRDRVAAVTIGAHGLTAQLRGGPPVYFGDTTRLRAKWAAIARVLSDPASHGATYLDVHTPERPAAQLGDPATTGAGVNAPGTAAGALVTGPALGG